MSTKQDRTEDTEQSHDRGQRDGAEGVYNPPDIDLSDVFTRASVQDKVVENKESYDKGWENGWKQR